MKICMAVTSSYDTDNRVRRQARSLSEAGHQVVVVCLDTVRGGQTDHDGGVTVRRVTPAPWRGGLHETPLGLWRYLRHLFSIGTGTQFAMYQVMLAEQADAYQAHDFDTLQPVAAAAQKLGRPFLYDSHELYIEGVNEFHGNTLAENLYTKFVVLFCRYTERKYIRRAARTLTVNHLIAEELARRYRIPVPLVVMNCVDWVATIEDPELQLKEKLHLPPEAVVMLYQGNYGRGRGLKQMITCLTELPANYHTVFLGYGELEHELQNYAQRMGLQNRTHFLPPVPFAQLLPLTASADIGLIATEDFNLSKRYGSPNKLFEYLMAGLPMVASDMPILRQVVDGEKVGFLFPSLAPKDMAETIVRLVRSPEYGTMKARCRQVAHDRYNWATEVQKLIDAYRALS